MSHKFLLNATFHSSLVIIDEDIIAEAQKKGCPCGGKLHRANYPRSPIGLPSCLRAYYEERLSLCCDTCRKRITPKSVRFFGQRWFPAPIFILIAILQCGISEYRLSQVKKHFGITVSESTWKRWRRWWREVFVTTNFWQRGKGILFPIEKTNQNIARTLFNLFSGYLEEKMRFLLQFLSPLTTSIFHVI
jgi:hypothetical protein